MGESDTNPAGTLNGGSLTERMKNAGQSGLQNRQRCRRLFYLSVELGLELCRLTSSLSALFVSGQTAEIPGLTLLRTEELDDGLLELALRERSLRRAVGRKVLPVGPRSERSIVR